MNRGRPPFSHLLCCLLAAALGLLWFRSYVCPDIVAVFIGKRSHLQAIGSFDGRVTILASTIPAGPGRAWSWDHDSFRPRTYRAIDQDFRKELALSYDLVGFGYGRTGLGATYAPTWSWRMFWLPHWLPIALLLIPPVRWSLRRWQRGRKGRCLECGYDLRESPERCPECGAASSSAPT